MIHMYNNLEGIFNKYNNFLQDYQNECALDGWAFLYQVVKRDDSYYYWIPFETFDEVWRVHEHIALVCALWEKNTKREVSLLVPDNPIWVEEEGWFCRIHKDYEPFFIWAKSPWSNLSK